jgi:hypothetical protein
MLTDALSAILEQVPPRDVRLVMFSLAEQKEFYHQNEFTQQDIDRAAQALASAELATVEVGALLSAKGAVNLLASLLNRELSDAAPPHAIVFRGPPGLSYDTRPAIRLRAEQKRSFSMSSAPAAYLSKQPTRETSESTACVRRVGLPAARREPF